MTPRDTGPEADDPGSGRPPLTPAQRRAVAGADPGTGELHASAATLSRLAALGLARPHGRRGAHYLTAEGRSCRDRLRGSATPPGADGTTTTDPVAGPPPPGFSPATGDGPPHTGDTRAAAAAQAWTSLLEIRRLTGDPAGRPQPPAPAPWERVRPLHAVALALEAAGAPPSAVNGSGRRVRSGFRVTDQGADPGTVRVEWHTAHGDDPGGDPGRNPADRTRSSQDHERAHVRDRLGECARLLADRGWHTERYTDARRRPYLLVAPRPADDTGPRPSLP